MTLMRVGRCVLRLVCCVLPLLAAGLIGELHAGWCASPVHTHLAA